MDRHSPVEIAKFRDPGSSFDDLAGYGNRARETHALLSGPGALVHYELSCSACVRLNSISRHHAVSGFFLVLGMDPGRSPDCTRVKEDGVLLYYKFVTLPDTEAVKEWFLLCCSNLSLVGRIRVASNGINVTVGGEMGALRSHTEAVAAHPLFGDIDFKLASCTTPVDTQIAAQCGFHSLSVRIVEEIVTLGLHPSIERPSISDAGLHVSPMQFHQILQDAASPPVTVGGGAALELRIAVKHCQDSVSHQAAAETPSSAVVLVDARNTYETSIGKFCPPSGVPCLDPMIRRYSDLPQWMDQNEDYLRGKQILMYCTGGIRCEMASAYLRSKGEGFQDVLQLSGGIQRYLEAFPDGGFFKGKNFVFDHRISVASLDSAVVGSCLVCAAAFDDYSTRTRCSLCRMLVLICNHCRKERNLGVQYVCALCQKHKAGTSTTISASKYGNAGKTTDNQPVELVSLSTEAILPSPDSSGDFVGGDPTSLQRQKLRILCLHGFRQSASNFKGRTSAFRKKLKAIADFTFIDAPHEVPLVCQSRQYTDRGDGGKHERISLDPDAFPRISGRKYAWLVSPESMQTANCSTCQSFGYPQRGSVQKILFDPLQYRTQTSGWDESWALLQKVFREQGPFDGVLGFSQGAAVAAALCPLRCTDSQRVVNFRFVICCSGYPSPALEPLAMSPANNSTAPIDCPSLHVFGGGGGHDRQIGSSESEQLASFFVSSSSVLVKHEFGHLIPAKGTYIQTYKEFLSQF